MNVLVKKSFCKLNKIFYITFQSHHSIHCYFIRMKKTKSLKWVILIILYYSNSFNWSFKFPYKWLGTLPLPLCLCSHQNQLMCSRPHIIWLAPLMPLMAWCFPNILFKEILLSSNMTTLFYDFMAINAFCYCFCIQVLYFYIQTFSLKTLVQEIYIFYLGIRSFHLKIDSIY